MIRKEKLEELNKYIDQLKTIKSKEIKTNKNGFLSIKQIECYLNNGKKIKREQVLKNKKEGSASVVLPITETNEVILVVQPRVATKLTVGIELPAGYIEDNEDPLISAKRELAEETGYVSKELKLLTKYYQDQGCSKALNYSFIALNCKKVMNQNLDKDEYIKYFKCTYEEALELVELGYIMDVNSIITLEKSKQYLRR